MHIMHSRYFDVFIVFAGGCRFGGWRGANWWHSQVWFCDDICHGNIPCRWRCGPHARVSRSNHLVVYRPTFSTCSAPWLSEYRPLSLRQTSYRWWSDVAGFSLGCACSVSPWCRLSPQMHWHAWPISVPSRRPTATRKASSPRRSPHAVIGTAESQSPLWVAAAVLLGDIAGCSHLVVTDKVALRLQCPMLSGWYSGDGPVSRKRIVISNLTVMHWCLLPPPDICVVWDSGVTAC